MAGRQGGGQAWSFLALTQPHLLSGRLSILNERAKKVVGTSGISQGAAKRWVSPLVGTLGWVWSLHKLNGLGSENDRYLA